MKSIEELALQEWYKIGYPVTADRIVLLCQRVVAAYTEQQGEVVVTTDEDGRCVAVTRQDEEGRILSVIWEAEQVPADMVLVPREPTEAMVQTGAKVLSEWVGGQVFDTKAYGAVSVFKEMIAAGEVKP